MLEPVEANKQYVHCHHTVMKEKDLIYYTSKEDAIFHVTHELIVMVHGLEHRIKLNIKTLDEYYQFQTLIVQWVRKHIDALEAKSANDAANKLLSGLLLYLSRRSLKRS